GVALAARGRLAIDARLRSAMPRIVLATAAMSLVLWGALLWLAEPLRQGIWVAGPILAGICVGGGLVYLTAGELLGVLRLRELRGLLRRQPGVKPNASESE
ncbi:MAG TPA: hypothetical protein VJ890_04320, partial [Vineibacter sp.]|nr:hypothetical protein [Vineibacter sp.]